MSPKQFKELKHGDIIRHKQPASVPFTVHANYGDRVTAVRTMDATNPAEWDLVREDGSVIYDVSDGYYWFKSERSIDRSIVQRVGGEWWTVNEVGSITMEELNHRGWYIDEPVENRDS